MQNELKLELVHFQITKSCNLRCYFCGQWGGNGFFSKENGEELTIDQWNDVIDDLKDYRKKTGNRIAVTIWGGEPMFSDKFEILSRKLHKEGFPLSMITNGVFINEHVELIEECYDKIFVSVDGPEFLHDSIRGEGTYLKVMNNLRLLKKGTPEITVMSVLTKDLVDNLEEHLESFNDTNIDELILQELIYLEKSEIEEYKNWLKEKFNMESKCADSWLGETDEEFDERKGKVLKNVLGKKYTYKLSYIPHGRTEERKYCLSPFRHAHVAWNGNVLYCTDFYDFSAGNVKEAKLTDIITNEISDKYREETMNSNCVTCNHCSWIKSTKFN